MRKKSSLVPYSERQLAGLRTSTQARKQETVSRLQMALESLKSNDRPITTQTIYQECGLSYASYARNPEALTLFRANSTHLTQKRKGTKSKLKKGSVTPVSPRDPLLNYKKTQLVTRLREAQLQVQEMEKQVATLVDACLERDARVVTLEAKLTELEPYRNFVEQVRQRVRREEDTNDTSLS